MTPVFFASPAELRRWLQKNHRTAQELWVGMYKKATGRPTVTWPELVDQVLCFGWIDGLRKGVDPESSKIRITPRRRGSNWSLRNIGRVGELKRLKLMKPAGLKAFAAREEKKSGIYTYENRPKTLTPALAKQFKAVPGALEFFRAQPPGYQFLITGWIMNAKRDDTRTRRLTLTIQMSAAGRRIDRASPGKNKL